MSSRNLHDRFLLVILMSLQSFVRLLCRENAFSKMRLFKILISCHLIKLYIWLKSNCYWLIDYWNIKYKPPNAIIGEKVYSGSCEGCYGLGFSLYLIFPRNKESNVWYEFSAYKIKVFSFLSYCLLRPRILVWINCSNFCRLLLAHSGNKLDPKE